MHCDTADDMNVVVQLRKLDSHGQPMSQINYPVPVELDAVPPVNTAITLGPQGAPACLVTASLAFILCTTLIRCRVLPRMPSSFTRVFVQFQQVYGARTILRP